MYSAIRAIAAKLGVRSPAPPRMSSGFTTGGQVVDSSAAVPAARRAAAARVFETGYSVVLSIFVRNRGSEDLYVVAFDADALPGEGTPTSDRAGDRHVIKVAADSSETFVFANGWRIRRGLVVAPSFGETKLDMVRPAGPDEEIVPSIYYNVEYDHDNAPAETHNGLGKLACGCKEGA